MATVFGAVAAVLATGGADVWAEGTPGPACVAVGRWSGVDGEGFSASRVVAEAVRRPVVFLGESHSNPEDHRWQLQTLAVLHAFNPDLVLAFEAFPRPAQPALDRWVGGELGEAEFLEESRWYEVWRYDPALYLPLFHFARMQGIPMLALNVDHALVAAVREKGWGGVAPERREGLSEPAPVLPAYRDYLARMFRSHRDRDSRFADEDGTERFIEAQATWDRAMAERIAEVRGRDRPPLVVAIVGRGHVEYGHGVPHQLASLGVLPAAVLLPWEEDRDCKELMAGETPVADAVFGVSAKPPAPLEPPKAMLGVLLEDTSGEVRVQQVIEKSVAADAGLKKDDVILEAAGVRVARNDRLVAIIRRQPPGTWLPLRIRRGDGLRDVLAKFPAEPKP